MSLPSDRGLIVCNPPYGERMLEQRSAQRLYQAFGRHIKFADGWKKYIISSEPEFEHYFGKPAAKKAQALQRTAAMQRLYVFLSGCVPPKAPSRRISGKYHAIFKTKPRGEGSFHEAYFYHKPGCGKI